MSESTKECQSCVSLKAACSKLEEDKKCLIAGRKISKNAEQFSPGQLRV